MISPIDDSSTIYVSMAVPLVGNEDVEAQAPKVDSKRDVTVSTLTVYVLGIFVGIFCSAVMYASVEKMITRYGSGNEVHSSSDEMMYSFLSVISNICDLNYLVTLVLSLIHI